jgi:hypothetical protein
MFHSKTNKDKVEMKEEIEEVTQKVKKAIVVYIKKCRAFYFRSRPYCLYMITYGLYFHTVQLLLIWQ